MWDGTSWYGFGPGLTGTVFAVCVFNDEVYAGGSFSQFTGHPKRVARWTGETWVDVGEGFNAAVRDLIVWDDGTGPALYACGDFSVLGGPNRVAKWNGTNWESLGLGVGLDGGGTNRPPANCMAVFDDGTGPAALRRRRLQHGHQPRRHRHQRPVHRQVGRDPVVLGRRRRGQQR